VSTRPPLRRLGAVCPDIYGPFAETPRRKGAKKVSAKGNELAPVFQVFQTSRHLSFGGPRESPSALRLLPRDHQHLSRGRMREEKSKTKSFRLKSSGILTQRSVRGHPLAISLHL